jgi:uncharacterized protein YjbI with pentapeptide repeats
MKIQIQHKVSGRVLFETDANSILEVLMIAIKAKTNLRGANLRGANLGGANLGYANLGYANLVGANLVGANLVGAKRILESGVAPASPVA